MLKSNSTTPKILRSETRLVFDESFISPCSLVSQFWIQSENMIENEFGDLENPTTDASISSFRLIRTQNFRKHAEHRETRRVLYLRVVKGGQKNVYGWGGKRVRGSRYSLSSLKSLKGNKCHKFYIPSSREACVIVWLCYCSFGIPFPLTMFEGMVRKNGGRRCRLVLGLVVRLRGGCFGGAGRVYELSFSIGPWHVFCFLIGMRLRLCSRLAHPCSRDFL